jgi:exopolysaccharide production repressor protein
MALPLFLRGLVIVLLAFAVATYLITGSLWTTVIDTVVVAVLVQVAYFLAVLLMVWRSPRSPEVGRGAGKREAAQGPAKEDKPAAEVARVPSRPSSPQT